MNQKPFFLMAWQHLTAYILVYFPGSEQSKQIVFAPSREPTFVNVPQNNFVEPFVLNPGTWTVVIEAEGILLVITPTHDTFLTSDWWCKPDFCSWRCQGGCCVYSLILIKWFLCPQDYLVLLPSAYYEAPILQIKVTEPCTYSSGPEASQKYVLTGIDYWPLF